MEFGGSIGGQRNFNANLIIVALLSFGLGSAILLWTALDRLLLHPLAVAHPELTTVGSTALSSEVNLNGNGAHPYTAAPTRLLITSCALPTSNHHGA